MCLSLDLYFFDVRTVERMLLKKKKEKFLCLSLIYPIMLVQDKMLIPCFMRFRLKSRSLVLRAKLTSGCEANDHQCRSRKQRFVVLLRQIRLVVCWRVDWSILIPMSDTHGFQTHFSRYCWFSITTQTFSGTVWKWNVSHLFYSTPFKTHNTALDYLTLAFNYLICNSFWMQAKLDKPLRNISEFLEHQEKGGPQKMFSRNFNAHQFLK